MKKLAVISLIVMFLTGQYAFASCPYESLSQTNEAQELTQEEMEELVINLLSSIDMEELEQIATSAISQGEVDWEMLINQAKGIEVVEPLDACQYGMFLVLFSLFIMMAGGNGLMIFLMGLAMAIVAC
jgi:hypothetical protein